MAGNMPGEPDLRRLNREFKAREQGVTAKVPTKMIGVRSGR